MTDTTPTNKGKKVQKSLDDEIAAAEERLKRLRQQKAEKERKELERNQKLIYAFLRAEKLDAVPIETWSKNLPQLRRLLKADTDKDAVKAEPEASKASKGTAGHTASDAARKVAPEPAATEPVTTGQQEEPAAA